MANRGDLLLIVGLVLSGFALLFLVIGFSTPNWLEQDTNYITQSRFEKLGLWKACFKNYVHKAFPGKQFNGCWWIFSEEYRPIWSYINPCKFNFYMFKLDQLRHFSLCSIEYFVVYL
jgi:hypothetical protein